ncbi:hypothetical protein LDENG_00299860 [Lucifuga dentata]|nr:hypothetical protein LDENG_00299860 [Lucifuga dentata]
MSCFLGGCPLVIETNANDGWGFVTITMLEVLTTGAQCLHRPKCSHSPATCQDSQISSTFQNIWEAEADKA